MNAAGHLSPAEAAAFLRPEGGLTPAARLALSDHLTACPACRVLLEGVRSEHFAAKGESPELARLFSGLLAAGQREESPAPEPWIGEAEFTRAALLACTPAEREDLRLFQNRLDRFDKERFIPGGTLEAAPPLPRRAGTPGPQRVPDGWWQWLLTGPGLALAGATVVLLLATALALPRVWGPVPGGRMATGGHLLRADLEDGPVQVRADGGVEGLASLPSDLRSAVLETVRRGAAPGALLGGLTRGGPSGGSPGLVASEPDPLALRPISPVKTSVEIDRPTFRWQAPPPGAPLEVLLQSGVGSEPLRSGLLPAGQTEWTPAVPLARGALYRWQVLPVSLDGSPGMPVRETRPGYLFKVLSADAHARLEALRTAPAGQSHLALGVAYAREGLRAEAEHEFRALYEQNAQSTLARRLLDSVEG